MRMAANFGGRFCWLLVCLYLATGIVSYARRFPAKIVTVVPRPDGLRVITDSGPRGRNANEFNAAMATGVAIWLATFFLRPKHGYVSLTLLVATVYATEPYRRWRLEQQISAIPETPIKPYEKLFFQRGISFIRDGVEAYHPKPTTEILNAVRRYGIDSIAVVPYGLYRQSEPEVTLGREAEEEALYVALIKVAHAQNIRVMLKPQLWVMPGMFPGAIKIEDPAAKARWFDSYNRFILHWARIAEKGHADIFVVGTELEKLSTDSAQWRNIVARVRQVYKGPLTYAANQGPDFERIDWWDSLDYIGLNEYYPLPDTLDFKVVIDKIHKVRERFPMPVLLTEVGFASVANSHREPWSEPRRDPDFEHQKRCYEALLKAFWHQPWFYGMYPWKLSAHGDVGPQDRSLTPWKKPAIDVLARYYRSSRPLDKPAPRADSAGNAHPRGSNSSHRAESP